jgi:hypothetical protein
LDIMEEEEERAVDVKKPEDEDVNNDVMDGDC